ncbi:hypothetical protein [Paracoccus sp. J39]|uniref:hypothetical protein n=1 Tax=Paracoccus sp. J39 TaxID=935848 RepID=UPI0012EB90B5|nr:hypothetical protein [Paracoccus sp. J39]
MGFTPAQVGAMTPWQFMACVEGYGRANGWKPDGGGGGADALSDADLKEMGIVGF